MSTAIASPIASSASSSAWPCGGGWRWSSRLQPEDLARAEAVLLINSLGCRPAQAFEGTALKAMTPRQAEVLWRELLECQPEALRP